MTDPTGPEPADPTTAPDLRAQSAVNFQLLADLATKPHPLLNISADCQFTCTTHNDDHYIGEVEQEARNAHHLLDMAGIPRDRGYSSDLDARTWRAITLIGDLRERLERIGDWHSRYLDLLGRQQRLIAELRQARVERDDATGRLITATAERDRLTEQNQHLMDALRGAAIDRDQANARAAQQARLAEQLKAGRATWKAKAEEIEADRDRLAADLASLGHWWCPHCEAIPPAVDDDEMGTCCGNQVEWSEPETLTSVKAYAETVKAARDQAWTERDGLAETIRQVREIHAPKPGWEREWQNPAEALANGWPACAGCWLPGIGYREIAKCPTRAALGDAGEGS